MIAYQKDFKWKEAIQIADKLQKEFSGSSAAKLASRYKEAYRAVGRQVGPAILKRWVQGKDIWDAWGVQAKKDAKARKPAAGVTMVLFFEEWCPHCRAEIPNIEALYERLKDKGLRVLALTKVSSPATDETVEKFVSESNLSFPVAIEDGRLSKRFGVTGIPAAAIIKEGIIEWRGHPKLVSDDFLHKYFAI
mmetsp:Transcript_29947/g.48383  ORF Transcript_29947/g.48383 Transcript_29947/m.48383 type:complete len:192 (-) Transcript_29947:181-756(-)